MPATAPRRDDTLVARFARAAERWIERPFIGRFGDGLIHFISYGEAARLVTDLAAGLAARGVAPGDRVTLRADARAVDTTCLLTLALARRAALAVPVVAPDDRPFDLDPDDPGAMRALVELGRRAPCAPCALTPEVPLVADPDPSETTPCTHAQVLTLASALRERLPFEATTVALSHLPALSLPHLAALCAVVDHGAALVHEPRAAALCAAARAAHPRLLFAPSAAAPSLHAALYAGLGDGPGAAPLLRAKLALARRRRELAAGRRKDPLVNLAHRLLDRVSTRRARLRLGHSIEAIAFFGTPPPGTIREGLELLGLPVVVVTPVAESAPG